MSAIPGAVTATAAMSPDRFCRRPRLTASAATGVSAPIAGAASAITFSVGLPPATRGFWVDRVVRTAGPEVDCDVAPRAPRRRAANGSSLPGWGGRITLAARVVAGRWRDLRAGAFRHLPLGWRTRFPHCCRVKGAEGFLCVPPRWCPVFSAPRPTRASARGRPAHELIRSSHAQGETVRVSASSRAR